MRKMGWWQQFSIPHEERDWDWGLRKEQHRHLTMNQGWEQRAENEFFCDPAVLLFCFFSADTVNMEGTRSGFFYRSHATSQWSMDAGLLQTYTVEHALCGSAKHGHLGEREKASPPPTLFPSILWTALSPIMPLCTFLLNFFSSL